MNLESIDTMNIIQHLSRLLQLLCFVAWFGTASAASLIDGADTGPAVDGYDTVAYFTDAKAVKGNKAYSTSYAGATWLFSSAEHRDLFIDNPQAYAPQYAGHCALATAHGGVASGDPTRWNIIDKKLYLNTNLIANQIWKNNIPDNIHNADKNWPQVQELITNK